MWLDQLRNMKANSGLTTLEIAMGSGLPEPTLEKLFAGATKDPKLSTMWQLVHFLGYTLDDLDDPTAATKNAPSVSDEALKLAKDYDALDEWGKKQVRATADIELERKRCTPSLSERYAEFQTTEIGDQLNVAASGGTEIPLETVESGSTANEPEDIPG